MAQRTKQNEELGKCLVDIWPSLNAIVTAKCGQKNTAYMVQVCSKHFFSF